MRTALVTTSINVPKALAVYRECHGDVGIFVAGDTRTPPEAAAFCESIRAHFISCAQQSEQYPQLSELLTWSTVGRRSIAILEAIRWGADIIITCDDDNLVTDLDYFDDFERVIASPFSGCQVKPAVWFNVGALCEPFFIQRGFPHGHLPNCYSVDSIVGAKVGVASGVAFGDPDIGAVERIAKGTHAHTATELLRAGVVFKPQWKQWTVFNSQVTAFTRELAPAFLMVPQWRRFDDIFASLICQRVMREFGQVIHYGRPFVHQSRNPHDLLRDLRAEMWGMQHVVEFADWLDDAVFPKDPSVLGMVRAIYRSIQNLPWMPPGVSELGLAWCADCEKVMV